MTSELTSQESFTGFVEEAEPRLKRAFCAAFGREAGVEATADSLSYAWEHWERIREIENPHGYLWVVGRNAARRNRPRRNLEFVRLVTDQTPWVEPGLPQALEQLPGAGLITVGSPLTRI